MYYNCEEIKRKTSISTYDVQTIDETAKNCIKLLEGEKWKGKKASPRASLISMLFSNSNYSCAVRRNC